MRAKFIYTGLAIIAQMVALNVFSQSWEKSQPNILFATDKSHHYENIKIGIGTENPLAPLQVKGQILTDSLHILKKIEIGNSLILGTFSPITGDYIYTDDGDLYIQSGVEYRTIFGSSLQLNSVGINNEDPFGGSTTIHGLDVNGDINLTDANW